MMDVDQYDDGFTATAYDGYGHGDESAAAAATLGVDPTAPTSNGENSDMLAMMADLDSMPVTQEDAWAVISAYFEEKGLVRQQLDSFDEFIQNTMQELVDDSGSIRVSPELQMTVGYDEETYEDAMNSTTKKVFEIKFGQVYLSKPTTVEKDGTVTNMFPHEARLRNLTYAAPLYVDVTMKEYRVRIDANISDPNEDMGTPISTEEARKEFLGYVPIMLRSLFCVLSDKDDAQLSDLGECIYDQGTLSLMVQRKSLLPKNACRIIMCTHLRRNNHPSSLGLLKHDRRWRIRRGRQVHCIYKCIKRVEKVVLRGIRFVVLCRIFGRIYRW